MVVLITGGTASERRAFAYEVSGLASEGNDVPWNSVLVVTSVGGWGDDRAAGKIVDVGRWCGVVGEMGRSLWNHIVIACDDFGASDDVSVDDACSRAISLAIANGVELTLSIDEQPADGVTSVRRSPRTAVGIMRLLWR